MIVVQAKRSPDKVVTEKKSFENTRQTLYGMDFKLFVVISVLLCSMCFTDAFVGNKVGKRLFKVTYLTVVCVL